jgi:hypothetical protein
MSMLSELKPSVDVWRWICIKRQGSRSLTERITKAHRLQQIPRIFTIGLLNKQESLRDNSGHRDFRATRLFFTQLEMVFQTN